MTSSRTNVSALTNARPRKRGRFVGEAKRRGTFEQRKAEAKGNPPKDAPLQRHVLAMIDRRIERQPDGETVFSDHSAKPNTYCSADMKTLYQWDGVSLRRVDKLARKGDTLGHSHS